jgi:hypothetical protein
MRLVCSFSVVAAWVLVGSLASAQDQPPPQVESKLVMGFEGEGDLLGIEITGEYEFVKDKELVTEGEAALKLKVKKPTEKGGGGTVEFTPMGKKYLIGWDKFDCLMLDVRNLSANKQSLVVRFDDANTKNQETRANVLKTLKPGLNTLKITLKTIARDNGGPFDIASLNRVVMYFWNPKEDFDVVFDNLRLVKEQKTAPPGPPPAK